MNYLDFFKDVKYLQDGGKYDWMLGPSLVDSETYTTVDNKSGGKKTDGSTQLQTFTTITYPEHNNAQHNIYMYNTSYGNSNAASESTFYDDNHVNVVLGDSLYSYYKDKNPEQY